MYGMVAVLTHHPVVLWVMYIMYITTESLHAIVKKLKVQACGNQTVEGRLAFERGPTLRGTHIITP